MRFIVTLLLSVFTFIAQAQNTLSLVSWNLKNFGKSKTNAELVFIAKTISSFDVVAIQEVVAGNGGVQAVSNLVEELNRKGADWSYSISAPTSGTPGSSERYAFLWKSDKIKALDQPWLDKRYAVQLDREPYLMRFKAKNTVILLANFHAIPKSKQPETEIKYLKFFPGLYAKDHLIFCGDFNLPQSHSVFNPLKKMGYTSALVNQKTSLRQKCLNDDCLASEYDNFYFHASKIKLKESGIIHFYKLFDDIKTARKLSDHVPVYSIFSIN
ncbi:MAG TPA: endonuclease/exonuclease/phosphatase family protein [Daejeonella sp.]|nr:endonuclease/exonuclease/phosphatase family protein [Daejeonella sp.]